MVQNVTPILFVAVAAVALIGGSEGANILGLFPSLSPSHLIIQMSAVKALAERGHNVTVVTVLKPAVSHKDINVIRVPLSTEESAEMSAIIEKMSKTDNKNMLYSMFRMIGQMNFMFRKMEDALKDPRVQDLYLNKDNKFDLVLSGFFMNDYQMGFARKVNAPLIVLATMPPNLLLNYLVGNPEEVSYVPSINDSVEKGKGLSFEQRLSGYLMSLGFKVFGRLTENRNKNTYKELFGDDPNMPEYSEMMKNASLVFFASHALSEGPVRPNVPGVIEIGGIQIKDTPAPLPQNMEEFLANATNGGILLSLGSNVQGKHLSPDTVQKMFNVLSKLKERVIWKWEDLENTPGKSDNILYSKWLPQDDILAHPKIKLFINHAGKGGLTEAQYHGKPMLSLPVFGDQPANADGMVKKGFGLTINLLTLEEQPFREGIEEILSNPKYSQTVSTFSKLYRDRPLTARETVIYWTEYVIRHHGAPHLQSPVMHMSFIAANNLDIYAILAIIVVVLLLLAKAVIKFIIRKLSSKSKKVKKQ
ncbi:UDP-glucuronosyltransferase 2B15-like isoform X3 [Drosophila guanche]|uniref:Blast:UDP-glucuronosyltransferase 2B15 n=2 Tax=Drosophila guanche TaxID=7266 RepID=A0A3B0KQI5_DROGU|nr:UDP-glucuronosyltransferase 2B15-like isoform X1 [Drosophila guanche]XP_034135022.1 UDP-glucuronosyltransferase 2B15-like isoform X2 [Drosophila guanche]XP_034135023.1 UDP-glucuronosyltransferase 2B15-like isoform X3 [Drosophila guanche]SPP86138.1 blast:UDP-glucuronosyltransferase 2B15 [Drosophila guanche]